MDEDIIDGLLALCLLFFGLSFTACLVFRYTPDLRRRLRRLLHKVGGGASDHAAADVHAEDEESADSDAQHPRKRATIRVVKQISHPQHHSAAAAAAPVVRKSALQSALSAPVPRPIKSINNNNDRTDVEAGKMAGQSAKNAVFIMAMGRSTDAVREWNRDTLAAQLSSEKKRTELAEPSTETKTLPPLFGGDGGESSTGFSMLLARYDALATARRQSV